MARYQALVLSLILALTPVFSMAQILFPILGGSSTPPLKVFITSQVLGSTRNNGTLPVGFQMVVGTSNLTVTSIGRWVISGNSQTHLLSIYDNNNSYVTSVTVNCNGATPGQYLYGAITPVTLIATDTYFVYSAENLGGDLWYDDNTTVTPNPAYGTVTHSAYNYNGSTHGGPNTSYVPVNFTVQ